MFYCFLLLGTSAHTKHFKHVTNSHWFDITERKGM